MSNTRRLLLRLRMRAVRWYELLLYAQLLALAFGVVLASSPGAPQEAAQCGQIQSSTPVSAR